MILNTVNRAHDLDILECIANLSTNEVATAPTLANKILDTLPLEVWSNPDLRWLDPGTKTGVFLREAARRLLAGLADVIPDEEVRRQHIYKRMLFGFPITELTGQISRRTLYYTKDASQGNQSVIEFESPGGNIPFVRFEHTFRGKAKNCSTCGAKRDAFDRGLDKDNHAYSFIHDKEVLSMRFDVIIGNPPYQLGDGGGGKGTSAKPIYHLFVNQAFKMKPKYVAMIIPSRWFSGGKGLDSFREKMLASTKFRKLVDYTDAKEVFPGTQIKGGVCYFLWDSEYDGPCEIVRIQNGEIGTSVKRRLNAHGKVFIRFNEATPILERVLDKSDEFLADQVTSRNAFNILSNYSDYKDSPFEGSIQFYCVEGVKWIPREATTRNVDLIDRWKTLIPKAGPGNDGYPHKILGEPLVAGPGSVCSETYLVVGHYDTEVEAKNMQSFLRTRFARFMIALVKNTQNLTKSGFEFTPKLPVDITWTDAKLFAHYGIGHEEQEFINTIVKPMIGPENG